MRVARGIADALVDQREVGLILVDRNGAAVDSNSRGRQILGRSGGLRERGGRLTTHRPEDAGALNKALRAALGRKKRRSSTTLGKWPHEQPLVVHVSPVFHEDLDDGAPLGVAAVLAIVNPWSRFRVSSDRVATLLGLTAAEGRVAAALAEGATVKEIASSTRRSPHSVRGLLKRALAKTFCSRQADLVKLVLSISRLPVPKEP